MCTVPICKGRGDRRERENYRVISTLSTPRKIYERVLISEVVESAKEYVVEIW